MISLMSSGIDAQEFTTVNHGKGNCYNDLVTTTHTNVDPSEVAKRPKPENTKARGRKNDRTNEETWRWAKLKRGFEMPVFRPVLKRSSK
jgi:hypothetical protein